MLIYHIPGAERVLELPIYRCTEERHRKEEDQRFESWIEPFEAGFYIGGRTPERVRIWERYREDAYGRAVTLYDFNQIVGWIRLYVLLGNIRAYLFFVRERITKVMRRKTFGTRRGNFIEMGVFSKDSNEEILAKLRARVLAQIAEYRHLRHLHVDMGVLDALGPHIDWLALTKPPVMPAFDPERFGAEFTAAQESSSI